MFCPNSICPTRREICISLVVSHFRKIDFVVVKMAFFTWAKSILRQYWCEMWKYFDIFVDRFSLVDQNVKIFVKGEFFCLTVSTFHRHFLHIVLIRNGLRPFLMRTRDSNAWWIVTERKKRFHHALSSRKIPSYENLW
jgi:hypothetical protein